MEYHDTHDERPASEIIAGHPWLLDDRQERRRRRRYSAVALLLQACLLAGWPQKSSSEKSVMVTPAAEPSQPVETHVTAVPSLSPVADKLIVASTRERDGGKNGVDHNPSSVGGVPPAPPMTAFPDSGASLPENFFVSYHELQSLGSAFIWRLPTLQISILDDRSGAWLEFVQELKRPIAFGCGEIRLSQPQTTWLMDGQVFAREIMDPGRFPMRIHNARDEAFIAALLARAETTLACPMSEIWTAVLFSREDHAAMVGKAVAAARRQGLDPNRLVEARLLFTRQPHLDLTVAGLRVDESVR
jgi:hypothetical protein